VVSYRRRFVLRLWSFVIRATGVADEDHRPTITHELNLIRDRRDDLTAYPAHKVHLVHACVNVRTALKVQDRAAFWRLRQGLQGNTLTVAIFGTRQIAILNSPYSVRSCRFPGERREAA